MILKTLLHSVLIIMFAVLCSCSPFLSVVAEAKRKSEIVLPQGTLNAKELKKLFVEKTVASQTVKKMRKSVTYYESDGNIRQVNYDGEYRKGKWNVTENGRLCLQIKNHRKKCRVVVHEDSGYKQYVLKRDNNHKHVINYLSFKNGNHLLKEPVKLRTIAALPSGTLNAEQVFNLFNNKAVESVTAVKKRKSLSYYHPFGLINQSRNGKARHGKWRVMEDGRICLQMESLREKCRVIVYEDGEYKKYIIKKNGKHVHSVSYTKFKNP
jgi:hypothetical protein